MDTKINSYKKAGTVEGRESRIIPLRQDRKTIDVDTAEKDRGKKADEDLGPSPEELLNRLLVKSENATHQISKSRSRWQLLSLLLSMFFIGSFLTNIWLYTDSANLIRQQDTLRMDKHTLTEQLQLAGTKVNEFSRQIDLLKNQNDRFAIENTNLRTQNGSLSTRAESLTTAELKQPADQPTAAEDKAHQPKPAPHDQSRLNAIQQGNYPQDMTKAELTAALGEPDRVYKDEVYEQLVYFGRSPGRFWFKNGPFLQAVE